MIQKKVIIIRKNVTINITSIWIPGLIFLNHTDRICVTTFTTRYNITTTTKGDKMENEFIEFDTKGGDVILIKMVNITLVKKNKREYPNWETSYTVCLNGQEGEVVYAQYKEYLANCAKQ
jgi:hypothetical protein